MVARSMKCGYHIFLFSAGFGVGGVLAAHIGWSAAIILVITFVLMVFAMGMSEYDD